MTDDIAGDDARYWAFISYSHRDAAFGRRLHRRLENYALPRRLVGRKTAQGGVPRKLAPIFRDREELPAAHDLSTEVRAALKASRSLIVVCSPSSAASQWVGREIEVFRELHPGRPILAAVRDGEPADCFPKALHGIGPDGAAIEPLAADFRRGRDGEQLGLLKLVAGIIGLGLDELIQRDAHRRNQRVTAVTAAALAGMIVMGVLTGFALSARQEAERQRGEALRLVKFMSTDLRTELSGVGRSDLMGAINSRALEFYDREADTSTRELLAGRAQTLQAIGEDEEDHDIHSNAIKHFREAWQITAAQLAESPAGPEQIFDQAQSEFWIGYYDMGQHDINGAKRRFGTYKHLAEKLLATEPRNPRSLRELAYAEGDLCTAELRKPQNAQAAVADCSAALANMQAAKNIQPNLMLIEYDLANRESWLGSAYRALHDNDNASLHWLAQEKILTGVRSNDPFNVPEIRAWVGLQRNLARIEDESGHSDEAKKRLTHALSLLDQTILIDPLNTLWTKTRDEIKKELSKIQPPSAKRNQP